MRSTGRPCGRRKLKQQLQDKLAAHKRYIRKNGEDMPEICDWRWGATT